MSSSRHDSSYHRRGEMPPRPAVRDVRYTRNRSVPPPRTIAQLESDTQNLRRVREELVARYSEIESEITSVKDRLYERKIRRQKLKEITGELDIAQRFLSTADSLSRTEVIRAMESLNEEIFQLTSIVADQISVKEKQVPDIDIQKLILERSTLLQIMDPYFKVIMPIAIDDPLAIQIGWQAVLVRFCLTTIGTWDIEDLYCSTGELERALQKMYKGIQSENDHAVSARWRSMVYGVTDDIPREIREEILHFLVVNLADLPHFCGYVSTQDHYNKISTSFRDRINPLFDKCLLIRKMLGKDITSTDIRPYLFEPGRKFDSTLPADLEHEMEKEESPKDKTGIIVCSVSLGLYCILESKGVIQSREPILKPKVILQNTFKEIIA